MSEKWIAKKHSRGWGVYTRKSLDCGGYVIQDVALLNYKGPEAEKNAYKLAAAEDMEGALDSILSKVSAASWDHLDEMNKTVVANEIWHTANDALAKARGESQ